MRKQLAINYSFMHVRASALWLYIDADGSGTRKRSAKKKKKIGEGTDAGRDACIMNHTAHAAMYVQTVTSGTRRRACACMQGPCIWLVKHVLRTAGSGRGPAWLASCIRQSACMMP